eukprot:scaffold230349_cov52-Attheya_sp.AAC.2
MRPSDDGGVHIDCAGDRLFSGPAARSDAPCIHTDYPGCGGMLAAVDLISVAVELDGLVVGVSGVVGGTWRWTVGWQFVLLVARMLVAFLNMGGWLLT